MKDIRNVNPVLLGITSVVKDTSDPDWATAITCDYFFEIPQELNVKVYQFNSEYAVTDLSKHSFIGETYFQLVTIMRVADNKLSLELSGLAGKGSSNSLGTLNVRVEPKVDSRDLFCVAFKGFKLVNKDGWFGTSDPFFCISRMNEDGTYTLVYKSNRIDNSLNPIWAYAKISLAELCNGDLMRPLKIEVFDFDNGGKHDLMGKVI